MRKIELSFVIAPETRAQPQVALRAPVWARVVLRGFSTQTPLHEGRNQWPRVDRPANIAWPDLLCKDQMFDHPSKQKHSFCNYF